MKDKKPEELIQNYLDGKITAEERAMLHAWYARRSGDLTNENTSPDYEYWNKKISQGLPISKKPKVFPFGIRISAAAAAVLLVVGAAFYLYKVNQVPGQSVRFANDVKAGGDKAYLILGNGKRISLTNAVNGMLAEQAGVKITKTADGQLVYQVTDQYKDQNSEYNIIETPRGGKYAIILPDGSRIWLNAASSMKYPATFAGLKNRKVELTGEAYFEIAKDKSHPFIVSTAKQDVEVLGTHFNISSYADEVNTKTTLLEGSVKVTALREGTTNQSPSSITIKPGQQSVLIGNAKIKVQDVDLEQVVAWKDGYFKFNDNLENIMTEVSRWYDVEIVYQTKPDPKLFFLAEISRSRNISALLKIIESTGSVHFKIEGRRIIVM